MKECSSIKQLERQLKNIDSVVAGDTAFIAKACMFNAKTLQKILETLEKTDDSVFLSYKIRIEKKTFLEALKELNERKEKESAKIEQETTT